MALMTMMNIATPQFMALILFAVYIAVGNTLTLAKTFTVIALIQQLRISIKIIPFAVMLAIGSHVGCKRLDNLFESTEMNTLQLNNEARVIEDEERIVEEDENVVISMKHASFKWTDKINAKSDLDKGSNDDFMLKDLSFKV